MDPFVGGAPVDGNGTWVEWEGSAARWPGEGFGEVRCRMRALQSEGWTLAEMEGRGGPCCSWCGQECGMKL